MRTVRDLTDLRAVLGEWRAEGARIALAPTMGALHAGHKALVEAAWLLLRYNRWAGRTVARISRGQRTRRKQAIVAVAGKLLVRCWALLRDGRPWDPRPAGCVPSP